MPHPVQLSNKAYENLTLFRESGESYSDAINRLITERKDPLGLMRLSEIEREPGWDEMMRKMNDADIAKAKLMFGDDITRNVDEDD